MVKTMSELAVCVDQVRIAIARAEAAAVAEATAFAREAGAAEAVAIRSRGDSGVDENEISAPLPIMANRCSFSLRL
jgi:hypothetical protein